MKFALQNSNSKFEEKEKVIKGKEGEKIRKKHRKRKKK